MTDLRILGRLGKRETMSKEPKPKKKLSATEQAKAEHRKKKAKARRQGKILLTSTERQRAKEVRQANAQKKSPKLSPKQFMGVVRKASKSSPKGSKARKEMAAELRSMRKKLKRPPKLSPKQKALGDLAKARNKLEGSRHTMTQRTAGMVRFNKARNIGPKQKRKMF